MAGTAPGHPALPREGCKAPGEFRKDLATCGLELRALAMSVCRSFCQSIHPSVWG